MISDYEKNLNYDFVINFVITIKNSSATEICSSTFER